MTKSVEKTSNSPMKSFKSKMSHVQLAILIAMTLCLTQIIDCGIDSFLFLGISHIAKLRKLKAEEVLKKRPVKKCRSFFLICRIRNKIQKTKDHYLGYLNFLPSMDTITGYGMGIICILIGVLMLIYFVFILTKMWCLWSTKRSLLDVILNYKMYFLLFLT